VEDGQSREAEHYQASASRARKQKGLSL
jgi:hypothetical protein